VATRLEGSAFHWRVATLVQGDTSRLSQMTPQADAQGARLIHSSTRPPLLFLHVVADTTQVSPRLTIRLAEPRDAKVQRQAGNSWVDQLGHAGKFTALPGIYRFLKPSSSDRLRRGQPGT